MGPTRTAHRMLPRLEEINGHTLSFRLMTPEDGKEMLAFSSSLPENDLIYMRWDITTEDGMHEWICNISLGRTTSVVVEEDGEIVGYGSLHHHQLTWTRHHGELRIMVSPELRGSGLGRRIVKDLYRIAKDLDLTRLVVQIASHQPRVRHMFEEIGFHAEALLTDWLIDRNDNMTDLIIMSMEIDEP